MQTNNHQIVDYDLVLDQKFGKEGTPERIKAEEDAFSFNSGQILLSSMQKNNLRNNCVLCALKGQQAHSPGHRPG